MLTASMLARIDRVLKEVYKSDVPFGGLDILLVGDFFQLPPVMSKDPLHKAIVHKTCNSGASGHDTIFGVNLFSRFELFNFFIQERIQDDFHKARISALRVTASSRPVTIDMLEGIPRLTKQDFKHPEW